MIDDEIIKQAYGHRVLDGFGLDETASVKEWMEYCKNKTMSHLERAFIIVCGKLKEAEEEIYWRDCDYLWTD